MMMLVEMLTGKIVTLGMEASDTSDTGKTITLADEAAGTSDCDKMKLVVVPTGKTIALGKDACGTPDIGMTIASSDVPSDTSCSVKMMVAGMLAGSNGASDTPDSVMNGGATYLNQPPTGSAGFPDNVEVNPNDIVPEPAPGQPYRECRTCKARNTVVGRHCRLCLRDLSGSVVTKGQSGRAAAGSALNSVRGP